MFLPFATSSDPTDRNKINSAYPPPVCVLAPGGISCVLSSALYRETDAALAVISVFSAKSRRYGPDSFSINGTHSTLFFIRAKYDGYRRFPALSYASFRAANYLILFVNSYRELSQSFVNYVFT